MMTTLTLLNGRIATAADYPDNLQHQGETWRNGSAKVGGTPVAVWFHTEGKYLVIDRMIDMALNAPMARPRIDVSEQIINHCRAYANKYAHLETTGAAS